MSATTQTLRQRHAVAAYRAARVDAIRHSERRALRIAEHEWHAAPWHTLTAVPSQQPSRLDRMLEALWRLHDGMRPLWVLLAVAIGAADGALLAIYFGWWQP